MYDLIGDVPGINDAWAGVVIPIYAALVIGAAFYRQMNQRRKDPIRAQVATQQVVFRVPALIKHDWGNGYFGRPYSYGTELVVHDDSFQVSFRNELAGRIFGREWYCYAHSTTIERTRSRFPPGTLHDCILAESDDRPSKVKRVLICPQGNIDDAWSALITAGARPRGGER